MADGYDWGGASSRRACEHPDRAIDGRKDDRMLDRIKDMTGIYKLGFNKYSFLGLILPLLFVIVVGGGLAALIALR
jgi:hypothetical protein